VTTNARRTLAAVAALVIAVAGVASTELRPVRYESSGALVLAPSPGTASDKTNLLQGYERSGTIGTFVELLDSEDTYVQAGAPAVDVTVRAVPDTRVIRVTATGSRAAVQPGLNEVMYAAQASQTTLSDLWELRRLERASAPSTAGPSDVQLLGASGLLAVLGGLAVLVLLARLTPPAAEPRRSRAAAGTESGADPEPLPLARTRAAG
jgi:hypothetical protein